MTVGQRIRQRREALGLSLADVAAALGKSRSTVCRYESEKINEMPISVIPPLARALGVRPEYLMGWVSEPEFVREETVSYNYYTPEEREIITQYRLKPEMQDAVKVLLGVKGE